MHNTHFIITTGQTAGEVMATVSSELNEYGNENNWYDIRRIIDLSSENDNPSDLEYLQAVVEILNNETSSNRKQDLLDQIHILQTRENEGRHTYWQLSEYYKKLYNIVGVNKEYTIDSIINNTCDEYFPYTYDEFGLTSWAQELYDNEKLYFVEIDMHS